MGSNTVFWGFWWICSVTLYHWASGFWHFKELWCHHLKGL